MEAKKSGEDEVSEEHTRGSDYINVQRLNENERNESDGGCDRGEIFTGQFFADSDVDDDEEIIDTDEEVDDPPLISAELIEERATTFAYSNANAGSDHTPNEEILRSSIAATLEDL
jgi:hypothetical protein